MSSMKVLGNEGRCYGGKLLLLYPYELPVEVPDQAGVKTGSC